MTSDSDAQAMRPAMLNRLKRPTKPAAAEGDTAPLNTSWIIGEAWPRTPMPAVTLRQSTAQSSGNWTVRNARSACTCPVVTRPPWSAGGVQPAGRQPAAGRRKPSAPAIIAVK